MKIRTGFVSNSSSSSFIVQDNCELGHNPASIAYHMILKRGWRNDHELIQKLTSALKDGEVQPYHAMSFPSTNYDTYIYYIVRDLPIGAIGKTHIYTCNNIDFEFPSGVESDPEDRGASEIEGILFYEIQSGIQGQVLTDSIRKEVQIDTNDSKYIYLGCSDCCYRELWLCKTLSYEQSLVCPGCAKLHYGKKSGRWKKI